MQPRAALLVNLMIALVFKVQQSFLECTVANTYLEPTHLPKWMGPHALKKEGRSYLELIKPSCNRQVPKYLSVTSVQTQ